MIYECQMCCAELQQNLENSLGNGTYHGSSEQLVYLISSSSPAYGNEQSKKWSKKEAWNWSWEIDQMEEDLSRLGTISNDWSIAQENINHSD